MDDITGDPGHQDRVLDVFGPLAQVGAGDGHNSAALHRTRNWIQLECESRKKPFFTLILKEEEEKEVKFLQSE